MSRFLTETLQALEPYVPGEQPQDMQYIKLNTNENPYPPSPKVVKAVNSGEVEKLRLYSDPECRQLLAAVAESYGIRPTQVMTGNGSDENLFFAFRAFCDESHGVTFADVTYGCYGVWADLMHLPVKKVPLKADFSLDPADYYHAGCTVVIANPNAPTGLALSVSQVETLLRQNPDNVVIIDEAYVDFGAESCVPLIDKYDNLLVVQTCSKSRSLAGARLGFAFGSEALIADLNRVKFSLNPYNINRLTLLAGAAAVKDKAYFDRCCRAIMDTRAWTVEQLKALGFECTDSVTNFLFVRTDKMEGGALYAALKSRGILVRHFGAARISDWLRITIGTPQQMQALVDTLREILK